MSESYHSSVYKRQRAFQMGHLRICDILVAEEEEEKKCGGGRFGMEESEYGCRSIDCMTMTPRATVSRWVSSLRKLREKISKRKEKMVCGELSPTRSMNCSIRKIAVEDPGNDNFEAGEESGDYRKDTTFSLGVGFGMAFFVAASKNELDKMTELRTQMEMLLQHVKEEWRRRETDSKQYQTMSSGVAYSATDIEESWKSNAQILHLNYTQPESIPCLENVMVYDQHSIYERSESGNCVFHEVNQLEAELEAELQRLELNLSTECSPRHPQQQIVMVAAENSASGGSPSSSIGAVIEDHDDIFSAEQNGVPPAELERRLHELLETRQEERIKELEAALEQARQKLIEKEKEVSWWKDSSGNFSACSKTSSAYCPTYSRGKLLAELTWNRADNFWRVRVTIKPYLMAYFLCESLYCQSLMASWFYDQCCEAAVLCQYSPKRRIKNGVLEVWFCARNSR